jgi:hypothetical protein
MSDDIRVVWNASGLWYDPPARPPSLWTRIWTMGVAVFVMALIAAVVVGWFVVIYILGGPEALGVSLLAGMLGLLVGALLSG